MALGKVERSCDAPCCTRRAAFLGSYTNNAGLRCTTAACDTEHVAERNARLLLDGYTPDWKPFPPRKRYIQKGATHADN